MKFGKTTLVIGNLIQKVKKDVSALIDIAYYKCDSIDVGDYNDNFPQFDKCTK